MICVEKENTSMTACESSEFSRNMVKVLTQDVAFMFFFFFLFFSKDTGAGLKNNYVRGPRLTEHLLQANDAIETTSNEGGGQAENPGHQQVCVCVYVFV